MTNAAAGNTMRERFLGRSPVTEKDRFAIFADMAESYVANTLETISGMDVAAPAGILDPDLARRMAEIRARLDGLDDLIVRLRELRAESRAYVGETAADPSIGGCPGTRHE